MEKAVLIIVACAVLAVSAWSPPYPFTCASAFEEIFSAIQTARNTYAVSYFKDAYRNYFVSITNNHTTSASLGVQCSVINAIKTNPTYATVKFTALYVTFVRFSVQSPEPSAEEAAWSRTKRDHYGDHHHHHHQGNGGGVTGPVHTFVKTDKKANYKWGVRHHVGPKYV
ncbi:hypothetical protein EVAR_5748_1 [Eumeta japonica]|uniref:Uncharacterized protein n=1 Tax=Eumeta variegata TaxID=151549 RepID=A0A4C1T477_EUMVA|nr:hypothetical protein EVAR_5748_1 [Eumeta japonica]